MRISLVFVLLVLVACQPLSTPVLPFSTPSASVFSATGTSVPIPESSAQPLPTVPPSAVELDGAQLPPGFSLMRFAEVERPTGFAFDREGLMYVTSQNGSVYILQDTDHDGRSDIQDVYYSGLVFPLGVAIHSPTGDVYVSHQGKITLLKDMDGDRRADKQRVFVDDLPFDKHQNDNLEFGPDGMLYMGLGSTCDACQDPDPRSASILRFDVVTGDAEIFATGMRNPYDIAFHPQTGDLFSTDNGRDDLGMHAPFEELNHVVPGGDYGYPGCWNEQDSAGCENSIPAIAFFEPHSSANSLDFYDGGAFPAEYRQDLFVAIFGSWLKLGLQTGIQRVELTPEGQTYRAQAGWFIRFPEGVMPLPLLFGPDDALYVGDYINNVVYRISYGLPAASSLLPWFPSLFQP